MTECERCGRSTDQTDLSGSWVCDHCREVMEDSGVSRPAGQLDLSKACQEEDNAEG